LAHPGYSGLKGRKTVVFVVGETVNFWQQFKREYKSAQNAVQ